jgi:hypothetical protein
VSNRIEKKVKKDKQSEFSDFLLYKSSDGKVYVEVFVREETVWLTQDKLANIFNVERSAITKHLKNIFETKELLESSVCSILEHTATDGKTYNVKFYNLKAIVAVGYRVNSEEAKNFRIWATERLEEYLVKGFTMDDERLKNPEHIFAKDYFDEQLARIRDIRSSERRFYQKITDIFAQCSVDYDVTSDITKDFFTTIQNKLHFAITHKTAAEIIYTRVSSAKENIGLTSWKQGPGGPIRKTDVVVAKNYLNEKELYGLNRIVSMYLDYAELQAENGVIMKMKDWQEKLDVFLQFNQKNILENIGTVSAQIAKSFAEGEYEKYRVIQNKTYESDFDKELKKLFLRDGIDYSL